MSRLFWGMTSVLLICITNFSESSAADWPMWRCDASRSGSSKEQLPAKLHLQWVRNYPALEPMGSGPRDLSKGTWDTTVGFEMVYAPIVLGKTMFVGSSINDSVTALDIETGEEKWRFYTGGPVRLAPVGWKGKIYVTSDDGFLYCLNAIDGKQHWKFRGAPMKNRVIGDERLVSAWPARGGPVLAPSATAGKATLYFAASIWPFMGVYIYALDAETGKVVWLNDEMGPKWRMDFGSKIAPQGSLMVVDNRLFVSNNRLGVTCFDRTTGKYLYDRSGRCTWRACGVDKFLFVENERHLSVFVNDIESGKVIAKMSRMPVLSKGVMYWIETGKVRGIAATELTKMEPATGKQGRGAKIPLRWKHKFKDKPVSPRGFDIKAKVGNQLLVSNGNVVIAMDIPAEGGESKEAWRVKVDGRVEDVLAASGRLFVVTKEGGIYCFGAEKMTAKTYAIAANSLPPTVDQWTKTAAHVLKTTGVSNGYALVLGLGSGRLMEALLRQSDLVIIGVDPDAKKVNALRRKLDAAGLYGKRGHCIIGDPLDCGLPPYLASLIVSEDLAAAGIGKGASFAGTVFRSLRPYGGMLCVPAETVTEATAKGWIKAAKLTGAEVTAATQSGTFTLLKRVGPLVGSAPWTHHNADAGNTVSSRDDLVRAPLGVLWFGGPSGVLTINRHHHGPRPGIVDGRIIVFGYEGLTAVDAYTGRILWRANDPEIMRSTDPYGPKRHGRIGSNRLGSPFVALPDGIYVAGGATCLRLDPATGKTVSKINLPADGDMKEFGPFRIWKDTLIAVLDPIRTIKEITSRGKDADHAGAGRYIIAFDRHNGKVLWSRKAVQGFSNGGIALGGDKVFCIDRWSPTPRVKVEGGKLLALELRTGKLIWEEDQNIFGTWLAYSPESEVLLQSAGVHAYKNMYKSRAIAYQAVDGKVLWDGKKGGGASIGPSMVNKSTIITQSALIMNLRTGEKIKSCKPLGGKCNGHIGSAHILTRRTGASAYLDLESNTQYPLSGFRPGCLNTHIPAEGVLSCIYAGTGCGCALNIRASVSLVHMPELGKKKKVD